MKTIAIQAFLFLFGLTTVYGQGLRTIGEIHDGTPQDIAAGAGVLYLAQGRHLALLDPATGSRTGNYTAEPYPEKLVAVEYDLSNDILFVATERKIHIYYQKDGTEHIWENTGQSKIEDFKYIASDSIIVAVLFDRIKIITHAGNEPFVVSSFATPPGISFFNRIHIAHTGDGYMAYLTGFITGQTIRGVNGLIIAYLDSENGYAAPSVYPAFWNPVTHYGSPAATVWNVQVVGNYMGQYTYAFVACGTEGQLTVLDVTDPSAISFVMKKELFAGFPVFNVLLDDANKRRLFAASANILHAVDIQSMDVLGSVNAGFYDAGNRDMALYNAGYRAYHVWTATHEGVGYVINAVNVTTNRLVHDIRHWWISSSDGAVAVPEWNSVYLPTFGGLVRYDISDIANPVAVNGSYRPAGGIIEHIDIMFPDPADKNHALLLTAPGSGGVQTWAISKENPDPGEPQKYVEKPSHWGNDPVYQNDVAFFQKDGVNYLLADLSNRKTQEIALQIFNMSTGQWLNVIDQSPGLTSNSKTVRVWGDYAFVTCTGGFFVVDLSNLPASAGITDVVPNDWNNDGRPDDVASLVVSDDGNHIFIAHRPGVVQSYQFHPAAGTVTGPLDILSGTDISGAVSPGGSYYAPLKRVYFPGDNGTIMEIDASDPSNLSLLSKWNNGGYFGEMQDCKIYDFGFGPALLAVKNNEGFAILKIEDAAASDLMAHWTFENDFDNQILDESGNAFHGTGYQIQYEDGPVSRAAVFNGSDSRIDFPGISLSPPAEIGTLDYGSISLWFKFQNMGADILPLFYFGESDPSLPHNSLIIEIGHNQDMADRRLYFTILVAPFQVTRFCFDSGFNLQENTWYHFVAVVSREGNTGYLNGVELTGRRYNLNSDATYTDFFAQVTAKKQLSLGYGRYGRNFSFFHFKGSLDDVRIYRNALTLADVQALYSLGAATSHSDYAFPSVNNLVMTNYPNPFNNSTAIRWESPVSGQTTLTISDVAGRRVKTLVDEYRQQGEYTVHFDSRELSSGTYFCQLKVGKQRITTRMMIVK